MKKVIQIPSNEAYLKEVNAYIEEILKLKKLSNSMLGYINLSICESIYNAIYHGNKQDINKKVTITIEFENDLLFVEVADEGDGYNYKNQPDPTKEENIKKEGGRGLFIIKHLVDEVNFKNNGSVIQLKFKLDREHQFL